MVKRKRRRLRKGVIVFLILFVGVVLSSGFALSDKFKGKDKDDNTVKDVPIKKIQVIDEDSNTRPIAVMINNHPSARPYHSGLQESYLTYEIIVEGGFTRYMSLFKDKDLSRIGSVRSSRHYFLDYALENDAIYVHWGYSPRAGKEMESYRVDHFDGIRYENKYFFRDRSLNVSLEHTGFTNTELINKAINDLGFRKETEAEILLNYSADNIDLKNKDQVEEAVEVIIPYSGAVTTSYKYDPVKKIYYRFVNGKEHVDYVSKKQYCVKNIITYQVSNSTLTGDVKGRQDIDNLGTGNGYYITNGYAVPIKWEKKYKASQTIYTYSDGTEINVNDGNTWIHIQPTSKKLTIKGNGES